MSNEEQKNEYNDTSKWRSICETTLKNYTNMLKRLESEDRTSKYILIYYSIAVIVYSLTSQFYQEIYNTELSNFVSIIMSVVLLIYSIVNSNAKYTERISKVEKSINDLKSLKRKFNQDNLDDQKDLYNKIVDSTEIRSDVDFFYTVKSMCRKNGTKWYNSIQSIKKERDKINENKDELNKIIDYLSEINRYYEQFRIFYKFMLKLLLYSVPVVIFVICIFTGHNQKI